VRIRVVVIEIVAHLLDDVTRHLGTARSVEVGDRMTVVFSLKGRELLSDLGDGQDLCFWFEHGLP
jgi:Cu/Ag efflux protein CusF